MTNAHRVRVIEISKQELQNLFNDERYWERAMYGELFQTVEEDGHPSPPLANEEVCTRSQIIAYRDDRGHQVARVHQYVRPDGTLGASGRPDPQEVLFEDALYIAEPPDPYGSGG
jgi:hypothetical protein